MSYRAAIAGWRLSARVRSACAVVVALSAGYWFADWADMSAARAAVLMLHGAYLGWAVTSALALYERAAILESAHETGGTR